jgi:hypothetical protein
MKGIFVIVIALLVTDARVRIDDKISVTFPESPDKNKLADQVYYMYSTDEIVYNAAYTDLKQLDRDKMETAAQRNKIYDGFIKGALDAATASKLLAKRDFNLKQHQGKEITYTKRFNGRSDVKIVKRILIVGHRLYQFEMWALKGDMDERKLSTFFGSIEIKG